MTRPVLDRFVELLRDLDRRTFIGRMCAVPDAGDMNWIGGIEVSLGDVPAVVVNGSTARRLQCVSCVGAMPEDRQMIGSLDGKVRHGCLLKRKNPERWPGCLQEDPTATAIGSG